MLTTNCLNRMIPHHDSTSREARAGSRAATVDTILDPAEQKEHDILWYNLLGSACWWKCYWKYFGSTSAGGGASAKYSGLRWNCMTQLYHPWNTFGNTLVGLGVSMLVERTRCKYFCISIAPTYCRGYNQKWRCFLFVDFNLEEYEKILYNKSKNLKISSGNGFRFFWLIRADRSKIN